MKLTNALSILIDLRLALAFAILPTLRDITHEPTLLFRWAALSRVFMAHVWTAFGDGTDENGKPVKLKLITPNAYGVVLDIGAGFGHTLRYLNRSRISRYIALEPNTLMHDRIRAEANANGFHESDGRLLILSCGMEETQKILSALSQSSTAHSPRSNSNSNSNSKSPNAPLVDTIVSVLTLCSVPQPQKNITRLVRDVLKPGGQLLMYEHVLSKREDVAWWQRFWAPVWALAFDGCRLDRPSDVWVRDVKVQGEDGKSIWREWKTWTKPGEEEENLFYHAVGRFVKV